MSIRLSSTDVPSNFHVQQLFFVSPDFGCFLVLSIFVSFTWVTPISDGGCVIVDLNQIRIYPPFVVGVLVCGFTYVCTFEHCCSATPVVVHLRCDIGGVCRSFPPGTFEHWFDSLRRLWSSINTVPQEAFSAHLCSESSTVSGIIYQHYASGSFFSFRGVT